MKKRVFFSTVLLTAFAVVAMGFTPAAESARDVVKKSDDNMQGKSSQSEMVMKIVRPGWTREVTMKTWSKGTSMSLILVTAPARDKGTAFLKRKSELWNWQPSIDRVIKMPPSMMMQSWMGSDFTNDDLVKESSIVEDYTHSFMGDTVIDGRPTHIIKLVPKANAAVVWGEIHVYIDKKDYLQLLVRYFDEDKMPVTVMRLSDIKKVDGRLIPTRLEMAPVDDPDKKTIVLYRSIEFDVDINDEFFSLQNLKKLR